MEINLKDRIYLLTGGTGYIGSILSYEILKRGGKIIITTTSHEKKKKYLKKLKKNFRNKCDIAIVDLNQEDQINNLVKFIKKKHHYINGIINNAYGGITGEINLIEKRDFLQATNLNLYAPFKLIKDLKKHLIKGANKSKESSSIVNIGSMYGSVSPDKNIYNLKKFENPIHYGSTKAGLIQMTKYLACNLNPKKIRVNCVSPGPIPQGKSSLKFLKNLSRKTPLKRTGKPIEVALPVIFLLSNSSSYINGVNLPIDGGWTAW